MKNSMTKKIRILLILVKSKLKIKKIIKLMQTYLIILHK